MTRTTRTLSLLAALGLAACGGSSTSDQVPPALGTTRGAITATSPSAISVNGVSLSTAGAAVRIDGAAASAASLKKGMVVTARGRFDDRAGEATEIEFEHGLEGPVDDKGADFIVVGGQRVHVDDSTEFENAGRLGSITAGGPTPSIVAISGVPDDKGGLRASRIDDSPRGTDGNAANDDDLDVKGFVSDVSGSSFRLRLTPQATAYFQVNATGVTLPAGFGNGAFVEVHTLVPVAPGAGDVLGTITASSIEVEDRFVEADAETEIEGIVSSGTSASFVVDGVTVVTDPATRWELGLPADLVPGVKVEAEGNLDQAGVLHADKVSFRPGVRIAARLQNVVFDPATGGTATILGVPVQLPSFARYDVTPVENARVEIRGNPSASGTGIVAMRVSDFSSGGGERVEVRAVVTAKANPTEGPTFAVLGFTIVTNVIADLIPNTTFKNLNDVPMAAADFFAAVEPGRTVVKARAVSPADVTGGEFLAEEIELEGND